MLRRLLDRVLREPVLVVATVISVAALFGQDLSSYEGFIESVVVVVGGLIARHYVTPVHDPRL